MPRAGVSAKASTAWTTTPADVSVPTHARIVEPVVMMSSNSNTMLSGCTRYEPRIRNRASARSTRCRAFDNCTDRLWPTAASMPTTVASFPCCSRSIRHTRFTNTAICCRPRALAEASEDGTGISTIEGADRTSGRSSAARARHAANGISHSRSSWSFHANTANRAAPVYCAHATAPAVTP